MRETTLLEVMAEVSREASAVLPVGRVCDMMIQADAHLEGAFRGGGDRRRESLKMAAAVLIRALHAHDAEAAQSSIDRSGHGPGCKVDSVMSQCTFDCPKRRARAADAKETR